MDTAAEEQAWDEAMHQALSIARAEGKAPGGVAETVRNAHASTLDWRTLLRPYMTDAARRDYSWSAPNRRFIDSGLYLPSMRSEGIDMIAVIIDTSGSAPSQTLAEVWAEFTARGVPLLHGHGVLELPRGRAALPHRILQLGDAAVQPEP